jgi:hypothetical protein
MGCWERQLADYTCLGDEVKIQPKKIGDEKKSKNRQVPNTALGGGVDGLLGRNFRSPGNNGVPA